MTDADRTPEIEAYLAAVERHLADLPEPIRDDLLTDLDSHLAEVAADREPGTSLSDLLGSPESYARELRETAEVPKEPARARARRRLAETAAPLAGRVKRAADGFAASSGHADAAELAERLRPGWWALRGALAAALILAWIAGTATFVVGYSIYDNPPGILLAVALLLLGVWASLKLGAASRGWGRTRRRWTAAAGIAVAAVAAFQYAGNFRAAETVYEPIGFESPAIADLYVYDADGNLLTGVYILDQNGEPVWIGDPYECDSRAPYSLGRETTEPGATARIEDGEYGYQYPLCPTYDPAPDPTPDPTSDPTPDPTETELPETTATPDGTAAPEETAAPTEAPATTPSPTPSE